MNATEKLIDLARFVDEQIDHQKEARLMDTVNIPPRDDRAPPFETDFTPPVVGEIVLYHRADRPGWESRAAIITAVYGEHDPYRADLHVFSTASDLGKPLSTMDFLPFAVRHADAPGGRFEAWWTR